MSLVKIYFWYLFVKLLHFVRLINFFLKKGARLTYEGLPTPNLGTGGYNYHGKYEYACIQEMETSVALLLKIVEKVNAE